MALLTTVFLALSATAAQSAGVVVSGPSPFAGCDTPTSHKEKTYANAEVEPWIASDPSDPNHLVGAWQQDRHAYGGANGLAAAASFDGGLTWTESTLPFATCAPGGLPYDRASDPWVSIGPDGTVYAVSISFDWKGWDNVTAVATSNDGGLTWNAPIVVHANLGPIGKQWFDDKESVTADPTRPGVAYIVWDRGGGADRDLGDRGRRIAAAGNYSQPAWFTMTNDGGLTWSEARPIYEPGNQRLTIGHEIVVDPSSGRLYDFFDFKRAPGRWQQAFITSDDGGATWSGRQTVASDRSRGLRDLRTRAPIRAGIGLPDAAVDPTSGAIYVTWGDARFSGYDEIALSRSTDGGATWSEPIRVNPDTGYPAFTPSVEVAADGTVGVSYYDLRDEQTVPAGITTSAWFVTLDPTLAPVAETRLAGPFDQKMAPFAGGRFLGDYAGLAVAGQTFTAFFAIANDGDKQNRTDIVSVAA